MRILFTNDLHGRLTEESAQRLAVMKHDEPAVLLDAGDALKVGNIGIPLRPEPIWDLMGQAGYDAMTLGNREFHITEIGLRAKLKGAPMPILCANMHEKGSEAPRLTPYIKLQGTPVTVGVIGLTIPMVTDRMQARHVSAFLFDAPVPVARKYALELRGDCQFLVLLSHLGLRRDLELAEAVPEINLIIGGHSHEVLTEPRMVGDVAIVQAGSHGRFVGEVTATKTTSGWGFQYRLTDL